MATHNSLAYPLHVKNVQSYQKLSANSVEISCDFGKELLSKSLKSEELEKMEE